MKFKNLARFHSIKLNVMCVCVERYQIENEYAAEKSLRKWDGASEM